jgi:hypothetical protein
MNRRVLSVSAQLIEESMETGAAHDAFRVRKGLPAGARLVAVHFDSYREELVLAFEHESFGESDGPIDVVLERKCRRGSAASADGAPVAEGAA